MRRFRHGFCLLAVASMALTGCQTTGDPTKGGLFGWSENKAKERIQTYDEELNRSRNQEQLKQEERGMLQNSVQLENQANAKLRASLQRLEAELRDADMRLASLTRELSQKPSLPSQTRTWQRIDQLNREFQRVRNDFNAVVRGATLEEDLRLKRVDELDRESQVLRREIELLEQELRP